jgi:hypothetical protein
MGVAIAEAYHPHNVHGSSDGKMLEMRFFLSDITRTPQTEYTNSLRDGSFYSSPTSVRGLKLLGFHVLAAHEYTMIGWGNRGNP